MSNEIRSRRAQHIVDGGRAFLPHWRMCQIRWEEAVQRSANKRGRRPVKDLQFVHWDCQCGMIGCLANPRQAV